MLPTADCNDGVTGTEAATRYTSRSWPRTSRARGLLTWSCPATWRLSRTDSPPLPQRIQPRHPGARHADLARLILRAAGRGRRLPAQLAQHADRPPGQPGADRLQRPPQPAEAEILVRL